jgi:hypothetical protein
MTPLVTVMIRLKWTFLRNAKVVCLFWGQLCQLYSQVVQVQGCHLFIQLQHKQLSVKMLSLVTVAKLESIVGTVSTTASTNVPSVDRPVNYTAHYLFGQHVNSNFIMPWLCPQFYLGQHLVCKGVAHDKRWVTHCTTKIHQSALSQDDYVVPIGQCVPIYLEFKHTNAICYNNVS